MIRILVGDCNDHMAAMESNCVDSIVTDPPYGLEFMGKGWDHGVPGIEFWQLALDVLKPGGYLLAFGGTRTFHRLTAAIEDAGFEIRDCLMWLYGSGFPKSLDVSKALDKAAGAEREVVGTRGLNSWANGASAGVAMKDDGGIRQDFEKVNALTAPATDLARQWDGWGTALKPAWEPIIMARKPLIGSVAANVTQYGTGGINVDGCRIEAEPELAKNWERNQSQAAKEGRNAMNGGLDTIDLRQYTPSGRWPANVLLGCACEGEGWYRCEDCHITKHISELTSGCPNCGETMVPVVDRHQPDCAVALLDAQREERGSSSRPNATTKPYSMSGQIFGERGDQLHHGGYGDTGGASRFFKTVNDDKERGKRPGGFVNTGAGKGDAVPNGPTYGDSGAVSRFFYTAKASRSERNKGLDGMPERANGLHDDDDYRKPGERKANHTSPMPTANHHPTVKPLDLMQWLVRLVTPPGGTVLDPFMGSGSTLIAADREGFHGIGIELDAEYAEIARRRVYGDAPMFAKAETT